jgi:hypothetical protein
MPSFSP